MIDTVRTKSTLQTIFADNTVGAISAQDVRDFVVSVVPSVVSVSNSPYIIDPVTQANVVLVNSGAITYELPSSASQTTNPSSPLKFVVADVSGITINANGSQTIRFPGLAVTIAGGYVSSTDLGAIASLVFDGDNWIAESWLGTWTVEDS